jgi:predicted secreted protein
MINKFLIIYILISFGIGMFFYFQNSNTYDINNLSKLSIKKGEDFTIKIKQNGSTGYVNCWINERKCRSVKVIERNYSRRWFSDLCDGCGGTISWTFSGFSKGIDTIKISYCLIGPLGVDCDYFSEDSIRLSTSDSLVVSDFDFLLKKNKKADYSFIVEVL